MFTLQWREQLVGAVQNEFDQLVASLSGWARKDHNHDGSHGNITADSITLLGGRVGELTNLVNNPGRFAGQGAARWTVETDEVMFLRYARVGQLVLAQFWLEDTNLATDSSDSLFISIPELTSVPIVPGGAVASFQLGGALTYADIDGEGVGTVSAAGSSSIQLQLDKWAPGTTTPAPFATGTVDVRGYCAFLIGR